VLNIEASRALVEKSYEEAVAHLESIISLDPAEGAAVRSKALALHSQGEQYYSMKILLLKQSYALRRP